MIKTEDGSILLPKGPRWPQPRRRSSLINNPLVMQLADSLVHKSEHATRAEQYSPPLAYGSALVSELRQDDESFFSDKSGVESEAPTLAAALGARRSSVLIIPPSAPSSSDSISSKRNRRPVSRHVSHIGYSQPNKVLSRLRRSSNGDDEMYPARMRRRSDETSMLLPGILHALGPSTLLTSLPCLSASLGDSATHCPCMPGVTLHMLQQLVKMPVATVNMRRL